MNFGEIIRQKRIQLDLTLREFCKKHQHDPSNWSKMERGLLQAPTEENTLMDWAEQLSIEKGSSEWYNFFDAAYLSRGSIPKDLMSDEDVVKKLPLFFRTMRGNKPSKQEIDEIVNIVKGK